MKSATLLLFFFAASRVLHGQQIEFGSPSDTRHVLVDIKSSPGVWGDRYYVLYNDYGAALDMKNNMDSYLKIYSASQCKLLRSVYLNPLVSSSTKVYFNKVMLWKGRILGLYVIRDPGADHLPIHGQLFDLNGKPRGAHAIVGSFRRPADRGNPLGAFPELQYGFDYDSSNLVLLSTPKEHADNAAFTVMDTNLHIVRKISCSLPFSASRAALIQFRPQGDTLYVLARESVGRVDTYTLFLVRGDGGRVTRVPLWLNGRTILDARFSMNRSGDVLISGTCCQGDKRAKQKPADAVFALEVHGGKLVSSDVQEFSDKMGALDRKASKKGKMGEEILIDQIVPAPDGFAVFAQREGLIAMVGGSTQMIRGYYEVYGDVIFYKIDAEGKISWCRGLARQQTHNSVFETAAGPVYGYVSPGGIRVIYDGENSRQRHKDGIYVDTYDANGNCDSHFVALPRGFPKNAEFIWRTARQNGSGQIDVAWYRPGKKQMGALKLTLP
jgi:hypothetical protein